MQRAGGEQTLALLSGCKNCWVISILTGSPTKANLKARKKASGGTDHGTSGGDRASREKTHTRRHRERRSVGLRMCAITIFLIPTFPFLRKRQTLITCRARSIWTQRVTEVIIVAHTSAAGLLRPLVHSNARLCCLWIGVDYRSVIPFLLLSVQQFFDVGEKCQQQPLYMGKGAWTPPTWLWWKERSLDNQPDLVPHIFLDSWESIKMNSTGKKYFITMWQCMNTSAYTIGHFVVSSTSKWRLASWFD